MDHCSVLAVGFEHHLIFTRTSLPFHQEITGSSPRAQSSSSCRGLQPHSFFALEIHDDFNICL